MPLAVEFPLEISEERKQKYGTCTICSQMIAHVSVRMNLYVPLADIKMWVYKNTWNCFSTNAFEIERGT